MRILTSKIIFIISLDGIVCSNKLYSKEFDRIFEDKKFLEKELDVNSDENKISLRDKKYQKNEITSILDQIENSENIEVVNLDNQYLNEVPDEILKFINLHKLSLRNNKLIDIPKFIDRFKNLKYFDLGTNLLESLPENILINLKYLNLEKNNFVNLNNIETLVNLEYLDLSNNKLEEIPINIRTLNKLNYLNLSNNKIVRISEDFKELFYHIKS